MKMVRALKDLIKYKLYFIILIAASVMGSVTYPGAFTEAVMSNKYNHIKNNVTELIIESAVYGEKKTLIDNDDYQQIKNFIWHLSKKDKKRFAICTRLNGKMNYIHRMIMNCPTGMVVDHINHNPLDNRKCNLRICTPKQNSYNNTSKNGNSKYVGVSFRKDKNKYRAYIFNNYKQITLGHFKTEIEAVIARDCAARIIYGEFANLNLK